MGLMPKEKPLSLHPMTFEQALKLAVSVPLPAKRVTKKGLKPKSSSKSSRKAS